MPEMPTKKDVEAVLEQLGFKRGKVGRANTYREPPDGTTASVTMELPPSQRFWHDNINPNGQGAIYIHGESDAVLVANGPHRELLVQGNSRVPHTGVCTRAQPTSEEAWRGDALWKALVMLARATGERQRR
jgi:hypothetical protein